MFYSLINLLIPTVQRTSLTGIQSALYSLCAVVFHEVLHTNPFSHQLHRSLLSFLRSIYYYTIGQNKPGYSIAITFALCQHLTTWLFLHLYSIIKCIIKFAILIVLTFSLSLDSCHDPCISNLVNLGNWSSKGPGSYSLLLPGSTLLLYTQH